MFKKVFIVVSFLFCCSFVNSQTQGLRVRVYDKKNHKPIKNALVSILSKGIETNKSYTDSNGSVKFQPIDTGIYDTKIVAPEYISYLVKGILVRMDICVWVEASLTLKSDSGVTKLNYGNVCTLGLPINKESSWKSGVFDSTDLNRLPTTDINYLLGFFPRH